MVCVPLMNMNSMNLTYSVGGGFVFGDLTGDAQLCLTMCEGAGLVIVDVNYRHCPEAPWGKGVEDSWAALRWVRHRALLCT